VEDGIALVVSKQLQTEPNENIMRLGLSLQATAVLVNSENIMRLALSLRNPRSYEGRCEKPVVGYSSNQTFPSSALTTQSLPLAR
jgi:hypothetical protein